VHLQHAHVTSAIRSVICSEVSLYTILHAVTALLSGAIQIIKCFIWGSFQIPTATGLQELAPVLSGAGLIRHVPYEKSPLSSGNPGNRPRYKKQAGHMGRKPRHKQCIQDRLRRRNRKLSVSFEFTPSLVCIQFGHQSNTLD
jgi:hypothetical protein